MINEQTEIESHLDNLIGIAKKEQLVLYLSELYKTKNCQQDAALDYIEKKLKTDNIA
jgi:hypothetical protein